MKYSFVNFLSIFSSFPCLCIVRLEWDIVLSSSYDGSDQCEYTMWQPREGNSSTTISDDHQSPPPVTYVLNWWSFSQPKNIKALEYGIPGNMNIRKNKFLCEKINGSVGWKCSVG